MDDNDLDLNLDNLEVQAEEKLKVKNRFDKLSEKVILTSKERDEKAQLAEKLQAENSSISKERDFYKDFSVNVSKYPEASNYQDKILDKVRKGYSTEDAMVAVLNAEGKLNTPAPTPPPMGQVEGGSAPNISSGEKSLSDMTPAEKLQALGEADKTGALVNALRGR